LGIVEKERGVQGGGLSRRQVDENKDKDPNKARKRMLQYVARPTLSSMVDDVKKDSGKPQTEKTC
jgi:hypothetical protein